VPKDKLKCRFEETIGYDEQGNETHRSVSIIEVLEIISPSQQELLL